MMKAIRAEKARRKAEEERRRVANDEGLIRQRCKSLYGFIEEFWYVLEPNRPFVGGWAIKAMCDHLEAVTRGDIQYLLITVPPGMMKSLLVAVFWPSWEWSLGLSSMRYLTSSYSEANVLRDNQKMRRLVECEKYQTLWGDTIQFARDQNAKGKFENTKTGGREGRSFQSMTGGRGDRVIIDDPHSVDTAESDVQRQSTITTFREAIPDRLNDMQKSAIVIIMQRLHEKDVAGTILSLGLPYVHLNLPMEFEIERRCRTSIGFEDPRSYDGELLFPERFTRIAVDGLKASKGQYAYAGQYQQRPTPREGGLFKREWFADKIITQAAAGTVWVRHWDLAATKKVTAARTAGVKLGRQPDGTFVVGHVVKTQEEGNKVRTLISFTAEVDGTEVRISLPQDPGQAGKVQAQDMVAMLAGYKASAEPETGDKVTRAEPFSSQCEAGNVYLVRGPWNDEYLDELCMFPGGSFKDQVDATSGAFGKLLNAKAAVKVTLPPRPQLAIPRQQAGQGWMK